MHHSEPDGIGDEGNVHHDELDGVDDDGSGHRDEQDGPEEEVADAGDAADSEAWGTWIVTDSEATRAKYAGRRKPYPPMPLPAEVLEVEKEYKPKQQPSKEPLCRPR